MTAHELLCAIPYCPSSEPGKGGKVYASRGELRRLLDQHAVRINGVRPTAKDEITFPVEDLVFFPGKPRQATLA